MEGCVKGAGAAEATAVDMAREAEAAAGGLEFSNGGGCSLDLAEYQHTPSCARITALGGCRLTVVRPQRMTQPEAGGKCLGMGG